MSHRQYNKLKEKLRGGEVSQSVAEQEHNQSSSDDDVDRTTNRFGDLDIGDDAEVDLEETEKNVADEQNGIAKGQLDPKIISAAKRRRAKKALKKAQPKDHDDGDESVDVDWTRLSNSHSNAVVSSLATPTASLLHVDVRQLNAEEEMRRKVNLSKAAPSAKKSQKAPCRFVRPKPHWPPLVKSGLSMQLLHTDAAGRHWFKFSHSKSYQTSQTDFWHMADSHDPSRIQNILHFRPYHIYSLIQLSDACRLSDNLETAADLIERALYSFQNCFHPLFSLTNGLSRLSYAYHENRSFLVTIFKHMEMVCQKGCYRTAFELAKLILSLSDDDPLAVLLTLDRLALRCNEHQWLAEFCAANEVGRNLSQLPNFAFSNALAHFLLSRTDTAAAAADRRARADQLLENALVMYPNALWPLLSRCNVQPDAGVQSCSLFAQPADAELHCSESLEVLVKLFVHLSFEFWTEPAVVQWLESATRRLVDAASARSQPFAQRVADCSKLRAARYTTLPLSIIRHLLLMELSADHSDHQLTDALRVDRLLTPHQRDHLYSFDPLPPPDAVESYSITRRPQPLNSDNWLSLFLRSFMPNFNMEEEMQRAANAERGAANADAQGGDEQNAMGMYDRLVQAWQNMMEYVEMPPGNGEPADAHENDHHSDTDDDDDYADMHIH